MRIPSFDDGALTGISQRLGDIGEPLIGRILGNILAECHIPDTSAETTKWKRLYHAFHVVQAEDKCGNRIAVFLESSFNPARWSANSVRGHYDESREAVNRALLTTGLEIGADGKLRAVPVASTVGEAYQRANRLRAQLEQRRMHAAVLTACARLVLKDDNYFHAVFEATKSVAVRLREISGSGKDGNPLVDGLSIAVSVHFLL